MTLVSNSSSSEMVVEFLKSGETEEREGEFLFLLEHVEFEILVTTCK